MNLMLLRNIEYRMQNIEPQKLEQHFEIHHSQFDILRFNRMPEYG